LLQSFFKKRNAAFNRRAHQARIDALLAEQGAAYFEKIKDWGTSAELPVFLVGLPGSGVTQVVELLTAHKGICRVGEGGSVLRSLAPDRADSNASASQLLPDRQTTETKAAGYRQQLSQLCPGAARVLVNSLDNYLALGLIATLFAGARVIHCRREPIEVALACYFQNRRDLPFACALEDVAAYLRAYDQLMAHWAKVLPLTIQEVRHEELIQEPEKTGRTLIAYCGLAWDEGCAPRTGVEGAGISGREAIGQARHYRAHLEPLIKALPSIMQ
jgi:hypothetical protein